MADVRLDIAAPHEENLVALRVYEGSASIGPFTQIDRTTEIGSFPGYVDSYLTSEALSATDWFYVGWEDDAGNVVATTSPVKGGSVQLVQIVVDRVEQRDLSLDSLIVTQEAEAAVESYFGADPYSILDLPSHTVLNGLVYLTMARCYLVSAAGDQESATLGLVRLQKNTQDSALVDKLLSAANQALGINTSRVLQMADIFRRSCSVEVIVP